MRSILLTFAFLFACSPSGETTIVPTQGESIGVVQRTRAVELRVSCGVRQWTGSGVIFSDHDILTAYHVVDCLERPVIRVFLDNGDISQASVVSDARAYDVAKIRVDRLLDPTGVLLGPSPEIDSRICFSPKVPDKYRVCGFVQDVEDGEIQHSAITQFGNSGSGAYDSEGRLVGIVSTLRRCQSIMPQVCGGGISVLWGLREELGI